MGNTSSSNHKGTQANNNNRHNHNITPTNIQNASTSKPHRPHPSLRAKKKSLELPDLASLAITPANSQHNSPHNQNRRLHPNQPSDPIAIPIRSVPPPSPHIASPNLHTVPSASDTMNDVLAPLHPIQEPGHTGRGRPNSHMRGAPLQYASTRSFGRTNNTNESQSNGTSTTPTNQTSSRPYSHRTPFVPEDVHSSIPLALRKAAVPPDADNVVSAASGSTSPSKEKARDVCIVWRGQGNNVALMRAADDWKEKREMEYDDSTKTFSTWVSLMPGTHHIRFVVDGIVVCAEDLPAAVDDNGSLANYVAVPISGQTPPSASLHPETRSAEDAAAFAEGVAAVTLVVPTPFQPSTHVPLLPLSHAPTGTLSSFLSPSPSPPIEQWTSEPPWQISCAAEEEEMWLAHRQPDLHSPPAHPQAPKLPRHLEKLILNARPPGAQRSHSSSHAGLATMVASTRSSGSPGPPISRPIGSTLPITTASGTNIASPIITRPSTLGVPNFPNTSPSSLLKLESQNLPDDGSVLPVPSHVVLQHLGTSAIKNGVLAVSSTNRYRKKYMTTIYYKPTST